jgi:hypothetical protein
MKKARDFGARVLLYTVIVSLFFLLLSSCAALGRRIDRSSLKTISERISEDFSPGEPEELRDFVYSFDSELHFSPSYPDGDVHSAIVRGRPPERWLLGDKVETALVERRYVFEGTFPLERQPGSGGGDAKVRDAVFYRYEHAGGDASGTVVFLPGLGVSDFAFRFIHRFFVDIIEEGWDLVIYVPPFHLERAGGTGDGGDDSHFRIVTDRIQRNIRYQAAMVREVRMMLGLLREEGAGPLAGWGGSMGAATLLLTDPFERWDHLALMIPVVDWNVVLTNDICMERCVEKYGDAGFERRLIEQAYGLISPVGYPLQTSPERVLVQIARRDQLIPPRFIRSYSEERGIERIEEYASSHSMIVLNREVYRDYAGFLAEMSGE